MPDATCRIPLAGCFVLFALFVAAAPGAPQQNPPSAVSLIVDAKLGPPARHGLDRLLEALHSRDIKVERRNSLRRARRSRAIVFGPAGGSGTVEELRSAADLTLPAEPESLLVRNLQWNGKNALLICGADDRGLMYAALDVARVIELSEPGSDPFSAIHDSHEEPSVRERGLSKIVMSQSEFETYFYSEDYWAKYLDLLAASRYNNFVLMFGWGAGSYMAPPYPYLFNIPEFPDVKVVGISPEKQQQNLDALKRIIRMTHERGMDFTLALWTHIHRAKQPVPGDVYGLTDDNLIAYTKIAFKRFLELVPGIDRIQFRVHTESALELPQQIPFWNMMLGVIADSGQPIKVDMRAKGFNDDMIDAALASKVPVRVATKHWGENMGLPYHPLHVEWRNQYDRRHGYADLLRYPKRYDVLWRLWNCGTTRVLLWGSREYARRFAESSHLYDSPGYEVNEPLAYKGSGSKEPAFRILTPKYDHCKWEFERYWYFYEVFGRIGYNPNLAAEFWRPEFERRFGAKATPAVQRAYEAASQVLPRIIAYNLVDLSSGRTWAEKDRWGDLPEYASAPPSDTGQFVGIAEAAKFYIEDRPSAKIWPRQTARWFASAGQRTLNAVAEAEASAPPNPGPEFVSTLIDMKVLGHLALYHSQRIPAGVNYALFERTGDLSALDNAIQQEREAVGTWEKIVALTNGVYNDDIIMGRRLRGHWKDELAALRRGLAKLEQVRRDYRPELSQTVYRFDFGDRPPREGYIRVSSRTSETPYTPLKGGYGWLRSNVISGDAAGANLDFVHGPPPDRYPRSAFVVEVPNGPYQIRFVTQDTSPNPRDHGPMWFEVEGRYATDPFRVPAGQRVKKTLEAEAVNGKLGIVFACETGKTWLLNEMEIRRIGPRIVHIPVRRAAPGEPVAIRATVASDAPVRRVSLRYGNAGSGFRTLSLSPAGRLVYSAAIPVGAVQPGLSYFLEAFDSNDRHVREPPVRVTVTSDDQPPRITHARVQQASARTPLRISATVVDPSGVQSVFVRCRSVTQYQEFAHVPMLPAGDSDRYEAEIPARFLDPRWDFMYYIEAFDTKGNGTMYPDMEKEAPYIIVKLRR